MEPSRDSLKVKLFADGADLAGMVEMASKTYITGLTTNPTLMRKSGVTNYVKFAKEVIKEIPNKPISFEVFSDDLNEMKNQALEIASWGKNVYVKIPISNTNGDSTHDTIAELTNQGVKINVTAIMTVNQVASVLPALKNHVPSVVSVFAGRIADTGRDPLPIMSKCLELLSMNKSSELIWASPREIFNVFQADQIGCHIITATNDILGKLNIVGTELEAYSLDTVKMFRNDAIAAGFVL
jgi:transaldolase